MLFARYPTLSMKPRTAKTLDFVWRIQTLYKMSKKTLDEIEQECYIRYRGTLGMLYNNNKEKETNVN